MSDLVNLSIKSGTSTTFTFSDIFENDQSDSDISEFSESGDDESGEVFEITSACLTRNGQSASLFIKTFGEVKNIEKRVLFCKLNENRPFQGLAIMLAEDFSIEVQGSDVDLR
jgi:hypothetical protein